MTTCTPCNGSGLVGSGPEPWKHIGHVVTCKECAGTGVVDDAAPAEETAAEEKPAEEAAKKADLSDDSSGTSGSTGTEPAN